MPPKTKNDVKKGRKRKAAPLVEPDPDEPYRRHIEETYYIPKPSLRQRDAIYGARIAVAVRAFTVAEPPIAADENLNEREAQINAVVATHVPMAVVPDVVRAVGLNPTAMQIKQIEFLVCGTEPLPPLPPPSSPHTAAENRVAICAFVEAAPLTETNVSAHTKKTSPDGTGKEEKSTGEDMKNNLNKSNAEAPEEEQEENNEDDYEEEGKYGWLMPTLRSSMAAARCAATPAPLQGPWADRAKLEAVLFDILHTGLLVYDPSKVQSVEAAAMYPKRTATVVEHARDAEAENVFHALWATMGRETNKDGGRIIKGDLLMQFLRNSAEMATSPEPPLDEDELDDFLLAAQDSDAGNIGEQNFVLSMVED